jgi:hypothetical protein
MSCSDVYIFGYQSILAAGSLATSIEDCNGPLVPARLKGYVRDWSAVRTFLTNETKRYVHAKDWHIAERVAFATLTQSANKTVNGVCRRIPSDQLAALDFREQGYTRIEVSQNIAPYEGYELDKSIRCYVYTDPAPDTRPAIVSRSYYDMGRLGAAHLSKLVPEFLADYLSSTEQPTLLVDDLVFLFFSGDGRHLWLLEESDSSLVLLHRFAVPQLTPLTRDPPELIRGVTSGLERLDARNRALSEFSGNGRVPLAIIRDLLSATNGEDVSTSPYWLCRLVAVESPQTSAAQLAALADDADFWVRRAAQISQRVRLLSAPIANPTEPYRSNPSADDPLSIEVPFPQRD